MKLSKQQQEVLKRMYRLLPAGLWRQRSEDLGLLRTLQSLERRGLAEPIILEGGEWWNLTDSGFGTTMSLFLSLAKTD